MGRILKENCGYIEEIKIEKFKRNIEKPSVLFNYINRKMFTR